MLNIEPCHYQSDSRKKQTSWCGNSGGYGEMKDIDICVWDNRRNSCQKNCYAYSSYQCSLDSTESKQKSHL